MKKLIFLFLIIPVIIFAQHEIGKIPLRQIDSIDTLHIKKVQWEAYLDGLTSGATQLSELSDVGTVGYTNRHVLIADGVNYDSRALTEADISDFGTYDNYQDWQLRVNNTSIDDITSGESLNFAAGTGISLAYDNFSVTINSTASGGSPGGSDGDIQYNNAGSFGGFGSWNGNNMDINGVIRILGSGSGHNLFIQDGYVLMGNHSSPPTSIVSGQSLFYVDGASDLPYYLNNTDTYTFDLTSTSDFRKKKDFKLIDSPLDKILKLQSYHFNWRNNWPDFAVDENIKIELQKDNSNRDATGMVAQEVEKVIPEVVGTLENGYKNIDYDALVPYLIEAIKEQQKQIEELKQEVTKLKR